MRWNLKEAEWWEHTNQRANLWSDEQKSHPAMHEGKAATQVEANGCSQRDSAEHEGYAKAHRSLISVWKERNSAQPELLEKILYKDNLNRAYKRVKANKGAPGIDGITVEEIGMYLRENQQTIIAKIYKGKHTPDAVRRVEIPKPDGGIRKLGIPTVKDRIFQLQ